ncbi:PHO85 cyclin-7 [Wickerhamomyces ciferrii]|uniref:PHO85 cyclin-7 n=1 Tax=Wickerhamomyces ciferrii (strain ATCC 14091 / BCRC 22168 / CBS 111 / JCM 3599 / NBRC 0793 / NRRL Y-1031 F-60-10) TaxID=1206466 RepID=K0KAA9_WICCF|nr:PHO85 cyclin-7 [Wickerhamomyces ciferrii]CCH41880.1 PHO85 cyclin-7 [Wickerhamomyces ciferrii]
MYIKISELQHQQQKLQISQAHHTTPFFLMQVNSSQPIVIPRQEPISKQSSNTSYNLPESYHTASSFKASPSDQQLPSSVNSTGSQSISVPIITPNLNNNSITNNISNLRNPFNSSSPSGHYSPRADPPSYYNANRTASMSESINNTPQFLRNNSSSNVSHSNSNISTNRPSLLTSKLSGSSNSIHQIQSNQSSTQPQQIQRQHSGHNSPNYPYPNPKNSSFRNPHLKSSMNFDQSQHIPHQQQISPQQAHNQTPNNHQFSSSVPNRSSNIEIQQPSTSQHFKTSELINSYTPYHNTPSVVSSSYSSASNSVPTHFNNNTLPNFQYSTSSIPTTNVNTEHITHNEFIKPSPYDTHNQQQQPYITRSDTESTTIPQEPNLNPKNDTSNLTEQELFSRSISQKLSNKPENHLDIVNHPVNDLLLMLSALLQKIVEANDSLHPHHYHQASQLHQSNKFTANVLAFHGRNVPAISLHAYLTRILKYCPVTNEVFLTLLVYFDRIAKRANAGDFDQENLQQNSNDIDSSSSISDQSKPQEQLFVMDSYNIHRLIIAGITVASKFFSDIFYKNSRYAKVGGLPLEELNHLELQFLLLTDFKLMIQIEELQRYADLLLKFWKREQLKNDEGNDEQEQQEQHLNENQNKPGHDADGDKDIDQSSSTTESVQS